MTWPRATRNLKHAHAGQLTAMQHAAAVLLDHERHLSPDVITVLCQIREETAAELKAREGNQQARQHSGTVLLPGQQVI
jgi:sugar (pentulose or hexulose) kinase